MSYILDALRKSHQARHPGTAPRTGAVHNISLAFPVNGWWLALGVVLLLGILAAVLIFWRGTLANLPEPPPVPAASEPVVAAEPEPPAPAAVEPPPPAAPVAKTPAGDLAAQAKLPAPAPRPKKITAARPAGKAAAARRTEISAGPAVPLVMDDTPLLQQMPESFRRGLPPLALTIHVYSHDKSQRILFINDREYREGSQIEGGIRVESVVPDGVVLSYRGERFKLGRPR